MGALVIRTSRRLADARAGALAQARSADPVVRAPQPRHSLVPSVGVVADGAAVDPRRRSVRRRSASGGTFTAGLRRLPDSHGACGQSAGSTTERRRHGDAGQWAARPYPTHLGGGIDDTTFTHAGSLHS